MLCRHHGWSSPTQHARSRQNSLINWLFVCLVSLLLFSYERPRHMRILANYWLNWLSSSSSHASVLPLSPRINAWRRTRLRLLGRRPRYLSATIVARAHANIRPSLFWSSLRHIIATSVCRHAIVFYWRPRLFTITGYVIIPLMVVITNCRRSLRLRHSVC